MTESDMLGRTKSSIWTFISQELFTVVSVLTAMAATPLLLHWLGDERFGSFEALTDWMGYIGLLELGVGEAIQALLARAYGVRDQASSRSILVAAFRVYCRVAFLMLAVGLLAAPFITRLIPVSAGCRRDLQVGWIIGLGACPLLPFAAFKMLAQSEQRGYWVNTALIGHWFLVTALSLIFAWVGWGIRGQALATLIGAGLFNAALAAAEIKRLPGVIKQLMSDPISKDAAADISNLRWPGLFFNLCGRFSFLTDNITVALLLSPRAVVPFFVTQRLASLGTRELQGIGGSSWAALSELHNQGKHQLFNDRLVELTNLIAILAVAGLIPVIGYNRYFVERWVGADRYGGDALTVIACINALLLATFSLWAWVLNATGHVRDILPGTAAQSAINLIASVSFTLKLGLIGPVLGTLLAFGLVSIWYLPMLLEQIFFTDVKQLIIALIKPVLLGVPYGALVYWYSIRYGSAAWLPIVVQMSACALGYLAVAAILLLSRAERAQWMDRIRLTIVSVVPS